jgi:hypothetical protein
VQDFARLLPKSCQINVKLIALGNRFKRDIDKRAKPRHQVVEIYCGNLLKIKTALKMIAKNDGYHVKQRGFRKIWSREQAIRSSTGYTNLYNRVQKLINYNSSL